MSSRSLLAVLLFFRLQMIRTGCYILWVGAQVEDVRVYPKVLAANAICRVSLFIVFSINLATGPRGFIFLFCTSFPYQGAVKGFEAGACGQNARVVSVVFIQKTMLVSFHSKYTDLNGPLVPPLCDCFEAVLASDVWSAHAFSSRSWYEIRIDFG